MLAIQDLHVYYGKVHAVKGINLSVHYGEVVALLGANGAGKSTILKAICGLIPKSKGSITFQNKDITNVKAYHLVKEGIGYVPEGRKIFPLLTVHENLLTGAYHRKDRKNIQLELQRIFEMFPILKTKQNELAGNLSGGQQQMVAVGRALMTGPRFLILDEPSMGLAPNIVKQIFEIIEVLRQAGLTILLVEQNAYMALNIANRAYVLETGHIALEGNAEDVKNNNRIQAIYLGM